MKRCCWAALICVGAMVATGVAPRASAPEPVRGFLFQEVEAQGRTYHYALYVPRDYSAERDWALIVFLHGMGECGDDGQRQLAVGLGPRVLWNPEQYPALVLFPQKPTAQSQWEDHLEAIEAMMAASTEAYRIDEDRITLTGLSQGGHGTWTINAAMPGTFAAIAPICGYVDVDEPEPGGEGDSFASVVEAAAGVPVWAFHGEADDVVPPGQSEAVVTALRERGADVRLTTYPGVGHNCWDRAYGSEGLGAWLLEQRRRDAAAP